MKAQERRERVVPCGCVCASEGVGVGAGIKEENRDFLTKQRKTSCLRVQFTKNNITESYSFHSSVCVCDVRCKFHNRFIEKKDGFSKASVSLRVGSGQKSGIAEKLAFLSCLSIC